jgi:hypothetical protein
MKFTMTKIAAGLALVAASAGVQAAAVSSITVTGGDFNMGGDFSSGSCGAGGPFGSWQCLTGGDNNTLTAGSTSSPASITAFNFFGGPVTSFLASSAASAANANDWTSGFQGVTDGSTITLNLGGFYANWNGTNFLQGTDSTGANGTSTAATGTVTNWNGTSGDFDITWHSYITTAPFDTQTGYWHLTGTVAAVPEASTYGMMLAGLGLVGFAVRRRKLVA